jgi:hypothetical protein
MATDIDSKVVLFADGTSIIITSPNQEGLQIALNKPLSDINSWFKVNFLSLNFNKTYYLLSLTHQLNAHKLSQSLYCVLIND